MTSSVIITHYHLRRGGVTRVIETASACLREAGVDHLVLSGEPYDGTVDLPVRVIDGLGYLSDPGTLTAAELAARLRAAATDAFGETPPLWHIHNHSLGKNRLMAGAVDRLAADGHPLLLQIHDFAEDGRPANYRLLDPADPLYPTAPQIRYALINGRDHDKLLSAGLPSSQATLLPNAITPPTGHPPSSILHPSSSSVLYPVRGIRRKNLGEIFLLAALAPANTRFAVTLGAANPVWQPVHDAWKNFGRDSNLPVDLEVVDRLPPAPGDQSTFESWLGAATHIVTTSVAEGFGLGFLEPIGLGIPLFGRDLPAVTGDFAHHDIQPGRLYQRLLFPQEWIGIDTLRSRLTGTLQRTLEAYGRPFDDDLLEQTLAHFRHRGRLDFANLPEDLQRDVITRLREPGAADQVLVETDSGTTPAREWLTTTLAATDPTADPDQLAPYSPAAYRDRLLSLYKDLATTSPAPPTELPREQVLAEFLHPASFHFLRT